MSQPTLTHRAVLPVVLPETSGARADLFAEVRRLARSWLDSKGLAGGELSSGLHRLDDRRTLTIANAFADGGETALRIRLHEDLPEGVFQTTVTVGVRPETECATVGVDLAVTRRAPNVHPAAPRIIRQLVRRLPIFDGPAQLTDEPRLVGPEDIEELLEVLTRDDRQLPALVAARPIQPNTRWDDRWYKIVSQTVGRASLWLLRDETTVDAFRDAVYDTHRVAPGAVRTFEPEVDPANSADAHRHRVLSFARLSDRGDRAWTNIAPAVQRASLSLPLPSELRQASFPGLAGLTGESRAARDQAQQAAADVRSEAADLRERLAQVLRLLDDAVKERDDLDGLLALADEETSDLRGRLRASEAEAADAALEYLVAQEKADGLAESEAVLRKRLIAAGRAEEAFPESAQRRSRTPSKVYWDGCPACPGSCSPETRSGGPPRQSWRLDRLVLDRQTGAGG